MLTTITIAGRSVPGFWLGLILVLLFSVTFKWLPASGYGSFKQLIMPAITLSAGLAASTARLTRSAMLEVMRQDYMTTARAKGVLERGVLIHHGLRNALLTVVTMFKGENHELSRSGKPKNRINRLAEITNWFEKYLK